MVVMARIQQTSDNITKVKQKQRNKNKEKKMDDVLALRLENKRAIHR